MATNTSRSRWRDTLPSPLPSRTFTKLTNRDKSAHYEMAAFENEWPPPAPKSETSVQRAMRLEEEDLARKKSEQIDACIEEHRVERERRRAQRKVILLGQSHSGKSTLLKSFQLQYAPQAFRAEAEAWRAVIYLNLVHSVNVLLEIVEASSIRTSKAIRHLQISLSPLRQVLTTLSETLALETSRGRRSGDHLDVEVWRARRASGISIHSSAWRSLAKVSDPGSATQDEVENARNIIVACRSDIAALWFNEDVRKCLKDQNVVLDSQAVYFLSQAERISSPEYLPLDDDILRARLETVGIEEHSVVFETVDRGQEWIWYDIEGSKSFRAAWIPYFDDVHDVLFVCSLANFDEPQGDFEMNKFDECLRLWRIICENKLLIDTFLFLFLNKSDLLEEKLRSGTFFGEYVEEYGHRPNDVETVSQYYKDKYVAIHRDFSPRPRLLQVHVICAIDVFVMAEVFEQARQAIHTAHMDSGGGAYGIKANDTEFRKKWDKDEYAEKAKQKDVEERERMQENEERLKQGKKPRKGRREDLPKPTELMKRREGSLELEKNLGKTMVVQNTSGRGPGVPGFFCEACNRTYKDSTGYLDHINGRAHLRALGQTTRIARSTVEQVRARIALLREKTKEASQAKTFDFEQRLAEVRDKEAAIRTERKAQKKAIKEQSRVELVKDVTMQDDDGMSAMMGFSGFGTSKK
ncbi:hypothetical protein EIP91_003542 [Steccherinum ochraceum]|uniref:C2H2-type domain-containing protein n=1 Tax=Steccherinum ochraceum TaxID=92696 RepID=A0A4R0RCX0_9APHY|nr:hypothetical protein EIP91_003542 [Steccherinum ochraceum]